MGTILLSEDPSEAASQGVPAPHSASAVVAPSDGSTTSRFGPESVKIGGSSSANGAGARESGGGGGDALDYAAAAAIPHSCIGVVSRDSEFVVQGGSALGNFACVGEADSNGGMHENRGASGLENGGECGPRDIHLVCPDVVGLQPVALVDHVARVDWSLLESVPGERGGSMRVTEEELDHILREVNSHFLMSANGVVEQGVKTLAGGSVANTIRGLAHGLGVKTALVGVRGTDDREGNRTMRPCFLNAVRLQSEELTGEDFKGAKWVVLNGYGFYGEDLLERAVDLCKEEGVKVSMDLASFEVVRNFRPTLMRLLESRKVDLVFANEDEARELIKAEQNPCPETCLNFLSKYCERAVVMLGSKGCIARHGNETVRVPAIKETIAVDTTGAGDLFASGFLYGVLNNFSLEDCCNMGCCTGGAVVRGLGGEVGEEGWEWMQQQLKFRKLSLIQHTTRTT
uniref:Carbohydrate kinase PfkB domain-containing protein n=1 Tax=Physcomitrium patens TaxID=3218 RepID=A0A7I4BH95_PHYPA